MGDDSMGGGGGILICSCRGLVLPGFLRKISGSGSKFGLSRGVPHPLCYKACRGQVVSYVCRAATLNPIFLFGFCKGLV